MTASDRCKTRILPGVKGMTPGLDSIMGAMLAGEFGAGSAVARTFRQVGGAIGVALLGDIYLNRYVGSLHLPTPLPAPVVKIARQSVGRQTLSQASSPLLWLGRCAARFLEAAERHSDPMAMAIALLTRRGAASGRKLRRRLARRRARVEWRRAGGRTGTGRHSGV